MAKPEKRYELVIEEDGYEDGVISAGLVDRPAIRSNWVAHKFGFASKEAQRVQHLDSKNYTVTGPLMIPDRDILELDENGEPVVVFYTQATVQKCAERFMAQGFTRRTDHMHTIQLDGNTIYESWIVKDSAKDKAAAMGMTVPVGTWMISVRINDRTYWDEFIQTGLVKGFSITGYFRRVEIKDQPQPKTMGLFTQTKAATKHAYTRQMVATPAGQQIELYLNDDGTKAFVLDLNTGKLAAPLDGIYQTEDGPFAIEKGNIKFATKKEQEMETQREKTKHREFLLADGNVVMLPETEGMHELYDADGNLVGTLNWELTSTEAETDPSATDTPVEEPAAVTNSQPGATATASTLTEIQNALKELSKELKGVKQAQASTAARLNRVQFTPEAREDEGKAPQKTPVLDKALTAELMTKTSPFKR